MDGINKKILAEYAPGYLAAQEAAEEAKDDLWAGMLAAEESAKTRIEQKRQERIQQLTHEERWRARLPPSRSVTWILPAHQEVRPPTNNPVSRSFHLTAGATVDQSLYSLRWRCTGRRTAGKQWGTEMYCPGFVAICGIRETIGLLS